VKRSGEGGVGAGCRGRVVGGGRGREMAGDRTRGRWVEPVMRRTGTVPAAEEGGDARDRR